MSAAGNEVDYGALFAAAATPGIILSPDLVIRDVNAAHLRASGLTRDQVIGRNVLEAFPTSPSDPDAGGAASLRTSLERVLATGAPDEMGIVRYDIARAGGGDFEHRLWRVTNTPVLGEDGAVRYILNAAEDVTDAERARAELTRREERFRALVEHATDLILVLGPDRRVLYMSPSAAVRQAGREGRPDLRWGDLTHPEDMAVSLGLFARVRAAPTGQTLREQFRLATEDGGGPRWIDVHATNHLDHPAIRGIVVNARDITEQRRAEQQLVEQAVRDPLTGLPNRRWFLDALGRAIARAGRSGRPVGVLLADVDDFKLVNDTLGHAAGDRLLVELAQRVSGALRPSDTVARLGGDEFVVLAEDLEDPLDAAAVGERIAAAASGRYDVGVALRPRITLSMGVSTARGEVDADTVLSHADAALYEAKRGGRDRIQIFSTALRDGMLQRLHAEHELERALAEDAALALHWQPIVRTEDGAVVAAEALVRWRHPERGLLTAAEFLPAARSAGLMPRVCSWVLARAVQQAAAWSALPLPLSIAINLSPQELSDPGLPDDLARLAAVHDVEPSRIHVEVSESLLAGQVTAIRDPLVKLRDAGFGIALDDFGAGNTALAWLQVLPIDMLKLDRRFSSTIDTTPSQAIVAAIVQLAAALGIASLAEGIQTEAQLRCLTDLGCDYTQGFLLGRPQAAEDLTARLTPA